MALRYSTPHLIVYPREPNSTIRKSSQAAAGEYGSILRDALYELAGASLAASVSGKTRQRRHGLAPPFCSAKARAAAPASDRSGKLPRGLRQTPRAEEATLGLALYARVPSNAGALGDPHHYLAAVRCKSVQSRENLRQSIDQWCMSVRLLRAPP